MPLMKSPTEKPKAGVILELALSRCRTLVDGLVEFYAQLRSDNGGGSNVAVSSLSAALLRSGMAWRLDAAPRQSVFTTSRVFKTAFSSTVWHFCINKLSSTL